MTSAECEIVAQAGQRLLAICEALTVPYNNPGNTLELLKAMDAATLDISEVYGRLAALPLDVEDNA